MARIACDKDIYDILQSSIAKPLSDEIKNNGRDEYCFQRSRNGIFKVVYDYATHYVDFSSIITKTILIKMLISGDIIFF